MCRLSTKLFVCVLALAVSGCADNQDTKVTDISTSNSAIELQEPAIFEIGFDYNSDDVFNHGDTVNLVVKVPPQLSYLKNSAQLNQWGGSDFNVTPYSRTCSDGTTYLAFVFDDNDLDNAHSSNNSDAELSVTLVGKRRGQQIAVEATASIDNVEYGCLEDFVADEQEIVDVE